MANNDTKYGHADWASEAYQNWIDRRINAFARKMQKYHDDFLVPEAHTVIGLPVVMGGLRVSQESELESV